MTTLVPCALLWLTAPAGRGQEASHDDGDASSSGLPVEPASTPARKEPPPPSVPGTPVAHSHTVAVRLPKHTRSDTGKVAGTSGLRGDSRIDEAPLGPSAEERPVPAKLLEEAGANLLRRVRIRLWHGLGHLAEVGRPGPAGTNPHERPPAAATLAELSQPGYSTTLPQPAAPTAPEGPPLATSAKVPSAALALAPVAPATAPLPDLPSAAGKAEVITVEADVFDRIRSEIKSRLPYFQACADAARRRGAPDFRRLQATWVIAEDGSIKQLRLEGATDPLLATCITRMGSRPFPVNPGTELTIPTPIVFVR